MNTLQLANTSHFHKGEVIRFNGESYVITEVTSKTTLKVRQFTFFDSLWYIIKKFFRGY